MSSVFLWVSNQILDCNGCPVQSGSLEFRNKDGDLTPIFADSQRTVLTQNPVSLDECGVAPVVYLPDDSEYDVVVKDACGEAIATYEDAHLSDQHYGVLSGSDAPSSAPPVGQWFYLDTSASPFTAWYWDGSAWRRIGERIADTIDVSATFNTSSGWSLSVNWNELCANAELLTSDFDGSKMLTCVDGEVKGQPFSKLFETAFGNACYALEDVGTVEGEIKRVAFVENPSDPACGKLVTFTEAGTAIASSTSASVYGAEHDLLVPTDPADPLTYYTYPNLTADVIAGTVDLALLDLTKIATVTFTLSSATHVEVDLDSTSVFSPAANAGAGRASVAVLTLNGAFPVRADGSPILAQKRFTNFETQYEGLFTLDLPAGTHTIEVYLTAFTSQASQPAQLRLVRSETSPGSGVFTGSNSLTVRRAAT